MSKTLILWALLIALVIVPFLLPNGGRYEGSDGQAEAAISQLAPDYQPGSVPCSSRPVVRWRACCSPCRGAWGQR